MEKTCTGSWPYGSGGRIWFADVHCAAAGGRAKADFSNVFDYEPHRGSRDARPENTLYSYAYAIEHGATSIECDMQLTKDGQIVMSHNPILNHDITRDEKGNYVEAGKYDIRKMTVSEIKKFNVGVMNPTTEYYKLHGSSQVTHDAKIPTLEELMQLIQKSGDKDVYLNIETKSIRTRLLARLIPITLIRRNLLRPSITL